MGVAGGLVGDRAQPEPLGRIEARAFDAAVVERQALGLAVFEIQLAVVHPGQRFGDERFDPSGAHAGAFKEQRVGNGEIGHSQLLKETASIWADAVESERRDHCRRGTQRRMRRLVATGWQGVNAVVASASCGVNYVLRTRPKARCRATIWSSGAGCCGSARKAPLGTLLRVARDG